jgi:hypothetical protein
MKSARNSPFRMRTSDVAVAHSPTRMLAMLRVRPMRRAMFGFTAGLLGSPSSYVRSRLLRECEHGRDLGDAGPETLPPFGAIDP